MISLRGVELRTLKRIADNLNLNTRALRVELEGIKNISTPAILHWDMNHFVVLKKVSRNKITIHDPAKGIINYSYKEFSKHFTGIVLELTPNISFTQKEEVKTIKLRNFFGKITGLKRTLVQIFFLSFLLQILSIVIPFYSQTVIDSVIISNDISFLNIITIGFLCVVVMQVITSSLRSFIILLLSSQLNFQMATNMFSRLLRLPLSFFEKRNMGDIVSRFGSLESIRNVISESVVQVIIDGFMAIVTLLVMFLYSPKLALVVTGISILFMLIRYLLTSVEKKNLEEQLVDKAKEQTTFMETVRAIQTIKSFGKEIDRLATWQNRFTNYINSSIQVGKIQITVANVKIFLFGAESILVIYFAAHEVIANEFTVGMLFAFLAFKAQFVERMNGFIDKIMEFRFLQLHLVRLSDLAFSDLEPNYYAKNEAPQQIDYAGELTMDDIKFRYSDYDPQILNNISIKVTPQKSTAIVGPSGAGKTTLLKLMSGLLVPTEGTISLDGKNIYDISLYEYRKHIAVVFQNDQLLSGTIWENICFGGDGRDMDWIMACAQTAAIHDDIMNMPMNYNTLVGELGASLSGGQQQRLFLARALYKKPKILFMDEATSHLDTTTESIVNSSIQKMNITRIIIAHRMETIKAADYVYHLDDNGIIDVSSDYQ